MRLHILPALLFVFVLGSSAATVEPQETQGGDLKDLADRIVETSETGVVYCSFDTSVRIAGSSVQASDPGRSTNVTQQARLKLSNAAKKKRFKKKKRKKPAAAAVLTTVTQSLRTSEPRDLLLRLHLIFRLVLIDGARHFKVVASPCHYDETDGIGRVKDFRIEPRIILKQLGNGLLGTLLNTTLKMNSHSYTHPPQDAAEVYGFDQWVRGPSNGKFDGPLQLLVEGTTLHSSNGGLGDPGRCVFDANKAHALLGGKGPKPKPQKAPTQAGIMLLPTMIEPTREVFVVIKPFININFDAAVFGPLIFRHIQHHSALGVVHTVIYVRRLHIGSLVSHPLIARLIKERRLSCVLYDLMPLHPLFTNYDQCLVNSHAMLAFLGTPSMLLVLDTDEFLVSPRPELNSAQAMIRVCGGLDSQHIQARHVKGPTGDNIDDIDYKLPAFQMLLHRVNVLCSAGPPLCTPDKAELPRWLLPLDTPHPLHSYNKSRRGDYLRHKSMFDPNVALLYKVHQGTLPKGYPSTAVHVQCAYIVRVKNLFRFKPGRKATAGKQDDAWMWVLPQVDAWQAKWAAG